jgi:hemerythrin superfamily protein
MPKPKTTERRTRARTHRAATSKSKTAAESGDILALLKEEHDEVKALFDQFESEADEDPKAGKATADKILAELMRHAEMEEQIVYPSLKEQDEDVYYEAHEEHHVAELLMAEIGKMSPDGAWKAKVIVLAENARHHIEEEESEGFTELKALGKEKLQELAQQWRTAKEQWTGGRKTGAA